MNADGQVVVGVRGGREAWGWGWGPLQCKTSAKPSAKPQCETPVRNPFKAYFLKEIIICVGGGEKLYYVDCFHVARVLY